MLLNTAASRVNEEHDRDWSSGDCSGSFSPRFFNDWSSVVSFTPRYAYRESANPFSSTIWTDYTTSYSLSITQVQDSVWWRTQVWLLSRHIILGLKRIFSNHQNQDTFLHDGARRSDDHLRWSWPTTPKHTQRTGLKADIFTLVSWRAFCERHYSWRSKPSRY